MIDLLTRNIALWEKDRKCNQIYSIRHQKMKLFLQVDSMNEQ